MYYKPMVALQIKNVPAEERDILSERARAKGQSLQAYLRELIEREARFASNVELARNFAVEGFTASSEDVLAATRAAKGYYESCDDSPARSTGA